MLRTIPVRGTRFGGRYTVSTILDRHFIHSTSPPLINDNKSSPSDEIFVSQLNSSFPLRWLRDSCQCELCVHPGTRQKLRRSTDDVVGREPLSSSSTEITAGEVCIDWIKEDGGTSHKSRYPISWLRNYATPDSRAKFHFDVSSNSFLWNRSTLQVSPSLFLDYSTLKADPSPGISQLLKFGLLFVRDVPNEATDDRDCEIRKLAGVFGRIRDTFYGESWDVKNVKNSTNIAYTNLDLGLHMDLLYFQHPPRYQILHCLRNRVEGGMSYFVDAIHTAERLRNINPEAFTLLAQTPVPYHYINDGHHMHRAHPVIQLSYFTRSVEHINYSPPFQAPLLSDTPLQFYDALKQFADLLDTEDDAFRHTLREGEAVIFDNRRVLHARTAFREKEGATTAEGEASRWLKGCYLEADDILDRWRMLSARNA
ncbi:hypothetical protein BU17DRAFT_38193 [Hysterangium stoloniferum]|nr:hypothetical protein BU17DRAFT_38193 [Hysterangium stoloniferum]